MAFRPTPQTIHQLATQLKETNIELQATQDQLHQATLHISQLQNKIQQANDRIMFLQNELNLAHKTIDNERTTVASLNDLLSHNTNTTISLLQNLNNQLKQENDKLKDEAQKNKHHIIETLQHTAQLETALTTAQENITKLQTQCATDVAKASEAVTILLGPHKHPQKRYKDIILDTFIDTLEDKNKPLYQANFKSNDGHANAAFDGFILKGISLIPLHWLTSSFYRSCPAGINRLAFFCFKTVECEAHNILATILLCAEDLDRTTSKSNISREQLNLKRDYINSIVNNFIHIVDSATPTFIKYLDALKLDTQINTLAPDINDAEDSYTSGADFMNKFIMPKLF